MRGQGSTDHVFLYRNRPLCKDLVASRIKAVGHAMGVKVYPHRLRHTCATQLLNAGCRITSIQKFLGHKKLNTTMIYARVHDRTVADDYYTAMKNVETHLELVGDIPKAPETISESGKGQLLALVEQLAQPEVSPETRLDLAMQIRNVLTGNRAAYLVAPAPCSERQLLEDSPPVSAQNR